MLRLAMQGAPVEFRVPLIPGFTANETNITDIINILSSCGAESVHLLPYHSMGECKARKIDSHLPPLNLSSYTTDELKKFQSLFEQENIATIVYR